MHLIGKEISRFHCVYWPAFLMAAGIPLPRSVRANGWLLFDQGKMSKSRGTSSAPKPFTRFWVPMLCGTSFCAKFLRPGRQFFFRCPGPALQRGSCQRLRQPGQPRGQHGPQVLRRCSAEAGAPTAAEISLRESAVAAIAAFGPAFDELNFSDALKALWVLVARPTAT